LAFAVALQAGCGGGDSEADGRPDGTGADDGEPADEGDGEAEAEPAEDAPEVPSDDGADEAAGEGAAPVEVPVFSGEIVSGVADRPNTREIEAEVDLPEAGPFRLIEVVFDLHTYCRRPTAWSDECDPYDRFTNVVVFGDDENAFEILRGITPFGDEGHYERDVTDYAPVLSGHRRIKLLVTTYADPTGAASGTNAQWGVDLLLRYHPGTPPREVLALIPVGGVVSYGPDTSPTETDLVIPGGAAGALILYYATGHGAVGYPPCDEFCRKTHTVDVDDGELWSQAPWRSDCADFCELDARGYCEGNQWGDPGSVRASRANWCPSDIVHPYEIDAGAALSPGSHRVRYAVADVEGYFYTSCVVVAYR
jgi:hypothetical protein